MKPKEFKKKLTLGKNTVANLDNIPMHRVRGGLSTPNTICFEGVPCDTNSCEGSCVNSCDCTEPYSCVCGGTGSDPCFPPDPDTII